MGFISCVSHPAVNDGERLEHGIVETQMTTLVRPATLKSSTATMQSDRLPSHRWYLTSLVYCFILSPLFAQTMDVYPPPQEAPLTQRDTETTMNRIFHHCRANSWDTVLQAVAEKPWLATTNIVMDNHISTTIIHQAITSKGNTEARAKVIRQILHTTPSAASIKNGYGSLPLHVITQRNTKIKSHVKEGLIRDFVFAYRGALLEEGGTGRRTPLHIIFTGKRFRNRFVRTNISFYNLLTVWFVFVIDYISPALTKLMIDEGQQACFMKDRKEWLPAHVACSRHCSPEKLRMLLDVYPGALFARTSNGETLLDLAKSTATKSHPNYALIDEINRQLTTAYNRPGAPFPPPGMYVPHGMAPPAMHMPYPVAAAAAAASAESPCTPAMLSEESDGSTRGRLDSSDSAKAWTEGDWGHVKIEGETGKRPSRKRKLNENNASEALLLLSRDKHFEDMLDDDGKEGAMKVYKV